MSVSVMSVHVYTRRSKLRANCEWRWELFFNLLIIINNQAFCLQDEGGVEAVVGGMHQNGAQKLRNGSNLGRYAPLQN
ncbi:hypothetical protein Q5A_010565 [Serratia inhibens PRI-2C]|uniref:Uncharacterized protein n=1 Tax=Serratia inhibens TaxID=2338073 RepID=A0AA92X8V6_9GAMM|nr:hypothetical protein Q5A_010565 [Serratia inhibens PRI-2C]RJF57925.1 hypothetical protein D4100_03900 [Serratia inhibens]